MKRRNLVRLFAVSAAAVPGLLLSASLASAQAISSDGFPASIPKAICGPTDHTESGLQGETTEQERFSGDSETAYNCNLQLVGEEPQDTYQGAYSQDGPAYSGHCAYYGSDRGFTTGQGIKAIDVSDPKHPVVTANLTDSHAALDPHETPHAQGGLLVAGQTNGSNFAVYDVSADCAHPVLKGQVNASSPSFHHMGDFSPDGKTFYASQNFMGVGGFLYIFDLSDPANPKELPPWQYLGDGAPHSLNLVPSGFLPGVPEGTLAFVGHPGSFPYTGGPDGLVVEDVSDYQNRLPNPQIRIISTLFWTDQGTTESMIPVKIKGHPYIISTDETGAMGGTLAGWAAACAGGVGPFGFPQIIDIADVTNPKIIAKLRLQVDDPANCSALLAETPQDVGTGPGTNLPGFFGTAQYSEERCVADNPDDTKMLACSLSNAGVRVFDVSDPSHPSEIAYWKSGAVRTKVLPASASWAVGVDRTVDKISAWVRWVVVGKDEGQDKAKHNNNGNSQGNNGNGQGNSHGNGNGVGGGPGNSADIQLWTVSDGHGFQVLQFSKSFTAQHKDLFANTVTTDHIP